IEFGIKKKKEDEDEPVADPVKQMSTSPNDTSPLASPQFKALFRRKSSGSSPVLPERVIPPAIADMSTVSNIEMSVTHVLQTRSELIPEELKPNIPIPIRLETTRDWMIVTRISLVIFNLRRHVNIFDVNESHLYLITTPAKNVKLLLTVK